MEIEFKRVDHDWRNQKAGIQNFLSTCAFQMLFPIEFSRYFMSYDAFNLDATLV